MVKSISCIRIATGVALIAGIAVLSGCGPTPYSHSDTSERTTTTIPSPVASTETITTERDPQRR
jgi:hypothetical protein